MVKGQSFIELYSNRACTDKLQKDENGCYIYDFPIISTNAYNPLTFSLFAKNDGDHSAYDLSVVCVNDEDTKVSVPITTVRSLGVGIIKISTPILKGETTTKTLEFKVSYDSI